MRQISIIGVALFFLACQPQPGIQPADLDATHADSSAADAHLEAGSGDVVEGPDAGAFDAVVTDHQDRDAGILPEAGPEEDAASLDAAALDTGTLDTNGALPELFASCSGDDDCGVEQFCTGSLCLPRPAETTDLVCVDDSDCASSQYCMMHQCQPDLRAGLVCSRDAECAEGHCVDGRCVVCGADSDCQVPQYCGQGLCALPATSQSPCTRDLMCLSQHCADGFCAGCVDDSQCPASHFCDANTCQPKLSIDSETTSASKCVTGYMVDNICKICTADQECGDERFCDNGHCVYPSLGGRPCNDPAHCASGQCVNGLCISQTLHCDASSLVQTLDAKPDLMLGCANPVPADGFVSDVSWYDQFFGFESMDGQAPPCALHSACYASCHCDKSHCDADFWVNLEAWCQQRFAGASALETQARANCLLAAEAYYTAGTSEDSGLRYETAQTEDCFPLLPDAALFGVAPNACEDTAYFRNRLCFPRASEGSFCLDHDQCLQSFCVDGVCANCASCAADQRCDHGVCVALLEANEQCHWDYECLSGDCTNIIGTCANCTDDAHCDEGKFCSHNYVVDGCLDKYPANSLCFRNGECASGRCVDICQECADSSECPEGNFCALNICHDKKANGLPCTDDDMCLSNKCSSLVCVACDGDSDCVDGEFCDFAVCHSRKEDGFPCVDDTQCLGGHCDIPVDLYLVSTPGVCGECAGDLGCNNDTEFCYYGVCHEKKAMGLPCNYDNWCETGHCAQPIFGEIVGGDIGLGGVCTCDPTTLLDRGCAADEVCADPILFHTDVPICLSKFPLGSPCHADNYCQSGHCGWDPIIGFKGCVNCTANEHCAADAFCEAGMCHLKKEALRPCTENFMCQSDYCINLHCAECGATPLIIDEMENVEAWYNLQAESQLVQSGAGAGRFALANSSALFSMMPSAPIDLSGSTHVGFWLYSQFANSQGLQLVFESQSEDASEWNYYGHELVVDWSGWSWVYLPKDSFVAVRNPVGWNHITMLSFYAHGWDHDPLADTVLVIDHLIGGSWATEQEACSDDEFCETNSGQCLPRLSFPAPCTDNFQCVSGVCGDVVGVGPSVCGCGSNAECDVDEFCETVSNACVSKLSFPAPCTDNFQCLSGVCGDVVGVGPSVCGCGSNAECDVDEFCETVSNACVSKLSFPAPCTDDEQCTSGVCADVLGTGPRVCGCASNAECDTDEYCETNSHACFGKKALLEFCTDDFQCQSDLCVDSHCGNCLDNPVVIDTVDSVVGWYGLSAETQQVAVGSGAGRFDIAAGKTLMSLIPATAMDFSAKSYLGFWLYSAVNNGQILSLVVESPRPDSTDWSYYYKELVVDWQGWRWIAIDKTSFGPVREPLGWQQISKFNIYARGWNSVPLDDSLLIFDHLVLTDRADGSYVCAGDQFCETNSDTCLPKYSFPMACTDSYQCVSSYCGDVIGVGPSVCGCASNTDCAADEFCETVSNGCASLLGLGTPCTDSYQCSSGLCFEAHCANCLSNADCADDQFCETASKLCLPKLSFPAPCSDGYQCVSGICGDIVGVGPSVCGCATNAECDADEFCETNSHACVNKFSFPAPCIDNYQCLSGYCGDVNGFGHVCGCLDDGDCGAEEWCELASNACFKKFPLGAYCNDPRQCQSDLCIDNHCGNCCSHDDCASEQWCESNSDTCWDLYAAGTPCTDGFQCVSGVCNKCATGCLPWPFDGTCWTVCTGCKTFCAFDQCIDVCAANVGYCE